MAAGAGSTLHSTNNFPEFTGRICPAPCEASCTLNIDDNPVTIKTIECAIVDRGWEEGWVAPQVPARRTGKRVAVVGSGPAGMACAQQLARAGHAVTLFEKADRIGGLLRYGIPDFKMEKRLIDRRVEQMAAEGVEFRTGVEVGVDVAGRANCWRDYDAVVLTGGAELPRDLEVPGPRPRRHPFRDGFPAAAEQARRRRRRGHGGAERHDQRRRQACRRDRRRRHRLGLHRHLEPPGRASITQLEIMPKPPEHENKALVWPDWPLKLRTSSSQEEGCERDWAVLTKRALGANGHVDALECVRVEWVQGADGRWTMREVPDSEFQLKADLVLLAMGFVGPRRAGLVEQAGVELDPRGNVAANTLDYQTSVPQGVRRRRHAARPVARRLGDPRGPPMRPRDRRVPDGLQQAAAVNHPRRIDSEPARSPYFAAFLLDDAAGAARPARRGEESGMMRDPGTIAGTERQRERSRRGRNDDDDNSRRPIRTIRNSHFRAGERP